MVELRSACTFTDIISKKWDTANVYSNGTSQSMAILLVQSLMHAGASEKVIGNAIKKYKIPRNKLVIMTKCYAAVGEEPGISTIRYSNEVRKSKDYINQYGGHGYDYLSLNLIYKEAD